MKTHDVVFLSFIIILMFMLAFVGTYKFLLPPAEGPFKHRENLRWAEYFSTLPGAGESAVPANWKLKKKPGTPPAVFSIVRDSKEGIKYLQMKADNASGSLVAVVGNMDIEKMPLLKWRWRAVTLPEGADGRYKDKDDQAIGIYVGSGSFLNNKSVSYRWDTETPKGAEGESTYGGGTVKVKWFTLRNKQDAKSVKWYTEERNIAEDFKNAWGFYPDKIYVSISCNSQYTGTTAVADLDWIELAEEKQ